MVFCTNCHCDIEDSKMFLHQRFCIQNIKYCEECKEGIIIEEFEEHCKNHKNKTEEKVPSQELKDSLTLKRVESSKIGCQYCGYFCSYGDLEEHEAMCGARTTTCKQCGINLLTKNLKTHITKEHNLDMENYKEFPSMSLDKTQNSSSLNENLGNLDLKRMTTDEEIAYALQLSEEEEQRRKQQEQNINKNKSKIISSNIYKKNSSLEKQKSEKIDFDELDYEYEKQLYEEEMNKYGKEE